jgi:hypothetical protein
VRRLPPASACESLFQIFFGDLNQLNSAVDETIFREELSCWKELAYDILLDHGPDRLPERLRYFPALLFQILALALQFVQTSSDPLIQELKLSPSQTFAQLSREYTECGVAIAELLEKSRPTLMAVQQSFIRDWWLINNGDLIQAWNHSGQTVE